MYTLVYTLYFILKRKQKRRLERGREESVLIGRIEWFYNVLVRNRYQKHPLHRYGLNQKPRKEPVIVSLTSYPKRSGTVWLTVETLLRQTVRPDKIILWLADSQYNGWEDLPKELREQQKRGLEIRFCSDLRSHKKYYFVMKEYSEALVILADDDMFYPYDTVETLLRLHKKHPLDVCTMTAQVMAPSRFANPSEWRNPMLDETFEHSDQIQIFSGSGSLFPPRTLDESVFDRDLIQSLCPYADDLWLTLMALKKGTGITMQRPWRAFPVTIYGTGVDSLWYVNAEGGQNDAQWKAMLAHFKEMEI